MPDLLCVLGHPIGHSLSPIMHNAAIADLQKDALYVAIDVEQKQLGQALQGLRALRFLGANLTIPHKELAMPWLDEMSDRARRIGAVNTIVRDGERLIGDNTDGAGWIQSVNRQLNVSLSGSKALILGAGGAARAIGDALLQANCESLTVANREVQRAKRLIAHFQEWSPKAKLRAIAIEEINTEAIDVLVNTTPVGMYGHLEGLLPIHQELIRPNMIVSDLVYRPLETPLLQAAKARGARVHGGLGMLIEQGALAFSQWFSEDPAISVMEQAVLAFLANHP